ncbi:MAG: hypothetical protein M3083_07760, partial [Actinomycetota bacterium]|nr:hypothetical protein [Actinomycetota bacterium]
MMLVLGGASISGAVMVNPRRTPLKRLVFSGFSIGAKPGFAVATCSVGGAGGAWGGAVCQRLAKWLLGGGGCGPSGRVGDSPGAPVVGGAPGDPEVGDAPTGIGGRGGATGGPVGGGGGASGGPSGAGGGASGGPIGASGGPIGAGGDPIGAGGDPTGAGGGA